MKTENRTLTESIQAQIEKFVIEYQNGKKESDDSIKFVQSIMRLQNSKLKTDALKTRQYDLIDEIVDGIKDEYYLKFPESYHFPEYKLKGGYYTAIGAYPGVGKTTLLANWTYDILKLQYYHILRAKAIYKKIDISEDDSEKVILKKQYEDCLKSTHRVLIFSFEMFRHELLQKICMLFLNEECLKLDIPIKNEFELKHIYLNIDKYPQLKNKLIEFNSVMNSTCFIVETRGMGIHDLWALYETINTTHLKYHNPNNRIEYVFIDYFQRIIPNQSNKENRIQMQDISRVLTDFAQATNCCPIVFSQLNKEGHFKETGGIMEDAALALIMESKQDSNQLNIKCLKNRFGRIVDYSLYKEFQYGKLYA